MKYKVEFEKNKVSKYIKKADYQLKQKIQEEVLKIAEDPFKSDKLRGKFKGFWSHHFSFYGVQYRIVYVIYKEKNSVGILHVGTRENFYNELEQVFYSIFSQSFFFKSCS